MVPDSSEKPAGGSIPDSAEKQRSVPDSAEKQRSIPDSAEMPRRRTLAVPNPDSTTAATRAEAASRDHNGLCREELNELLQRHLDGAGGAAGAARTADVASADAALLNALGPDPGAIVRSVRTL